MQDFNAMSTPQLHKQNQWHRLALLIVWSGVALALLATSYAYLRDGIFQLTLFMVCLMAVAASYPVYLQKTKIVQLLYARNGRN